MNERMLTENLKRMRVTSPDVDIVGDMPYKEGWLLNSFFAIGHFCVKEDTIDYLYHLMTYEIPGMDSMMIYCFSVTNETTGEYEQFCETYPLAETTADPQEFRLITPNGFMKGTLDDLVFQATSDKISLDLQLTAVGYPLYNGGTGKFRMAGMELYEYSIPTLRTNGTITLNGKVYEIRNGLSWYDRQWEIKIPKMPGIVKNAASKMMSGKSSGFNDLKWGWMDINLENGDVLSTWFTGDDEEGSCWATLMHPDGSSKQVDVSPVAPSLTEYWTSPASGNRYPMSYRIAIPDLDADLAVTCLVKDQELYFRNLPMLNHYEGASAVSGTYQGEPVKGYCYVELLGQW